jgi:acyl-CoA synthetase (AMP-forming)/AMP-acid ligase II
MLSRLTATQAMPSPRLRLCVVSGAPLPSGLAAAVQQRLCGNLVERYGMTEVSPLTMRRVPLDGGSPGEVGHPLSGVVVRTVDSAGEGELEAAAPTMFSGYDGDADATSAALRGGFLRTGDLGSVAGDGRVTITGRLKDVIVRGGHKVPAGEVERVIEAHPDVVEVAVVGVPDPDLGEEVVAVLVSARGDGVVDELRQLCAAQLARYMQPRRWYVLGSLPRTSSGKVRKQELRASLR